MTTALLLVLPVIGMMILGIAARFAMGGKAVELESISSVWPTVLEALPPVEREQREQREQREPVEIRHAA